MTKKFSLTIIILVIGMSSALAEGRFVEKLILPSGQTVVISEGEFEVRSIGSFSIRLYEAAAAVDQTTFFSSGLISPRDGTIEKVIVSDINDDSQPEIIVVIRSVGTGNYLSAYAFRIDNMQSLQLNSMVEDLPFETDPILALKSLVPGNSQ